MDKYSNTWIFHVWYFTERVGVITDVTNKETIDISLEVNGITYKVSWIGLTDIGEGVFKPFEKKCKQLTDRLR